MSEEVIQENQWKDAYKETPKVGRKILVMFEDGVYDIATYSKVTWGENPKGFGIILKTIIGKNGKS